MTNDVFYPGPVHVAYSPFDPFDIGEPRTFAEDDVTFLTVPSWGEIARLRKIEEAARAVEKWAPDVSSVTFRRKVNNLRAALEADHA